MPETDTITADTITTDTSITSPTSLITTPVRTILPGAWHLHALIHDPYNTSATTRSIHSAINSTPPVHTSTPGSGSGCLTFSTQGYMSVQLYDTKPQGQGDGAPGGATMYCGRCFLEERTAGHEDAILQCSLDMADFPVSGGAVRHLRWVVKFLQSEDREMRLMVMIPEVGLREETQARECVGLVWQRIEPMMADEEMGPRRMREVAGRVYMVSRGLNWSWIRRGVFQGEGSV